MSDFFRTGMGHRFYEGTMPELVEQLRRLNDHLDSLDKMLTKHNQLIELIEVLKDIEHKLK